MVESGEWLKRRGPLTPLAVHVLGIQLFLTREMASSSLRVATQRPSAIPQGPFFFSTYLFSRKSANMVPRKSANLSTHLLYVDSLGRREADGRSSFRRRI